MNIGMQNEERYWSLKYLFVEFFDETNEKKTF